MGLDMYLNKKTYVGANYEHNKVAGKIQLTKDGKKVNIKLNRVSEIKEQVAYWRKSNQIHAWFVKNVQKGVDDCGKYDVTLAQIKELVELCEKVLKIKGQSVALLPPQSGFFFGNTEIDDYYYSNLKDTVKMLKPLIKELEKDEKAGQSSYLEYHSSW